MAAVISVAVGLCPLMMNDFYQVTNQKSESSLRRGEVKRNKLHRRAVNTSQQLSQLSFYDFIMCVIEVVSVSIRQIKKHLNDWFSSFKIFFFIFYISYLY